MKTLIISSSELRESKKQNPCYEIKKLLQSAEKYYEKIILLNPKDAVYSILPEKNQLNILYENENINNSTSLIVRNTTHCEEATRLLALSLYKLQCELLDPIERFNGSPAGKTIMSLKGMKDKSLPNTYIAFTKEEALRLFKQLNSFNPFPLVGKPSTGSQGRDIQILRSEKETIDYIEFFFAKYTNQGTGLIFQKYIEIQNEYRVILLDGEVLGMVEKLAPDEGITRNAANGSKFVSCSINSVAEFALKRNSHKGLIGVDIAIDVQEKYYNIETNRSPQWKAFEESTGIDIAQKIIERLEKRLKVSSELF